MSKKVTGPNVDLTGEAGVLYKKIYTSFEKVLLRYGLEGADSATLTSVVCTVEEATRGGRVKITERDDWLRADRETLLKLARAREKNKKLPRVFQGLFVPAMDQVVKDLTNCRE